MTMNLHKNINKRSLSIMKEGDGDSRARRLAYLTVWGPTVGFATAVVFSLIVGWRMLDFVLFASMYGLTCFGVEGGLHRLFSHRSYRVPEWLRASIGILGCMAAQGPILFWVATHRIHHAFTDTSEDPHSPVPGIFTGRSWLFSLWHGHVGWLFSVKRKNWAGFVPDLFESRLILWVNAHYWSWIFLGLLIPTLIGAAIDGWEGAIGGLLWGGFARIFILDHVTWGVNSLCHTFGRRPYSTNDRSTNLAWLALPSAGGSWHNNHHAHPALAYNDHRPWQLDPSAWVIRLLGRLGLAWDIRQLGKQKLAGTPLSESKYTEGISNERSR
ncbi:acyl-CoA desaturase [Alcaligenes aquatilis]|uniref:acyl-CoA desaturase n=1 Tax=Alcaligenes aquatilis TaxID=323284 RepID=UPI003619B79B